MMMAVTILGTMKMMAVVTMVTVIFTGDADGSCDDGDGDGDLYNDGGDDDGSDS